ncbi:MAG: putative Ig domain-containing protein [Lysobacterales bacterium]
MAWLLGLSLTVLAAQAAQAHARTVAGTALSMTPPPGTLDAPYIAAFNQTFSASGGIGPYRYALSGMLPQGIGFNASAGTLSGVPTVPGAYPITITATDEGNTNPGGPFTVAQSYTLNVAAPVITITPSTLPDPALGAIYSQVLRADGGAPSYGYAITAGSLPTGLSLASSGAMSGTTLQVGTYNFTVTATDFFGQTGIRGYAYSVPAPTLSLSPSPGTLNAPLGAPYSQTFSATGGSNRFSYIQTGVLPPGLSVSVSGNLISGTPTIPGSYTVGVTATDLDVIGVGAPYSITQVYTIHVAVPVSVSPTALPSASAGQAYSQTLSASGGVAPYGFALTAGTLPTGLTLTGDVLAGTPTQAGSFHLTITATDANGERGEQAYTLVVAAPTLALAPAAGTLTAPYASAYTQSFAASGSPGPFAYTLSGALPTGLSFSGNTLTGTPITPGDYPITLTATDTTLTGTGAPFAISQNYTLRVPAPSIVLAPTTLLGASAGQAYSQALSASGGAAPYDYALTAGALPAGMTLSPSGLLSGTPTAVGSGNLTVTATDIHGQSGTREYTLVAAAPTLALTPAAGTLTAPYASAYTQSFAASGSPGPYAYTLSGALPTGLSFSGHTLTGTPTTPGDYPITLTATDTTLTGTGAPFAISQNYTLRVPAPSIVLAPTTLPGANAGQAYSQTLSASGGAAPYGYALTAGALPPGLTLSPSGLLSGTPSASGSYGVTITATDAHGPSGSQSYTLGVAVPTLSLQPTSLPDGIGGTPYSQTLVASGGIAPYTYALSAGTLPAGLSLSSAGALSGTATVAGSFAFSVRANDSTGGTAASVTQAYTLVMAPPLISLTTPLPTHLSQGAPFAQQLSGSGGAAPYRYALSAGSLPAGLTLSQSGLLSGTPNTPGSYTFTLTITEASGFSGSATYTMRVLQYADPVPTLGPASLLLMLLALLALAALTTRRNQV